MVVWSGPAAGTTVDRSRIGTEPSECDDLLITSEVLVDLRALRRRADRYFMSGLAERPANIGVPGVRRAFALVTQDRRILSGEQTSVSVAHAISH